MKKFSLALITTALGLSTTMAVNAKVFVDEQVNDNFKAIENAKTTETQDVVKRVHKKTHLTNRVSTTDLQKKVSTFNHVGKKTSVEKIQGFVNDISIKEAIENIVPEDWKVRVNEKVNLDKRVNFAGGETWNDTLERIGKDNFSATFNWDKKELNIIPNETHYKAHTVTSTENEGKKFKSISNGDYNSMFKHKSAAKVVAKPVENKTIKSTSSMDKKVVKAGSWLLSKELTLKENIETWAKKAGWTVFWKAPDYRVVADATLTGEIDSENGPIISILKLYEDANLPLKVTIMGGNKVIGVESRNYIPKDSVDLSGK